MPRYLISFDDGSMDHIPEQDWPAVGESAHAVVREAKAAGVWIFGGGLQRRTGMGDKVPGPPRTGHHARDDAPALGAALYW